MTEEEAKLQDELASFRQKFIDAMDDDVNTCLLYTSRCV